MSSGPTLSEERRRELGSVALKLRLPAETVALLESEAARSGRTRTAIVVDALTRALAGTRKKRP